MNILFIHPNFPGQFKHLVRHYAADLTSKVVFACRFSNNLEIEGIEKIVVPPANVAKNKNTHSYLQELEVATHKAQSMWRALHNLKRQGFVPDIIYAHPGWGDAMLVKDLFPQSKYIAYMEFFYRAKGADVGFRDKNVSNDHKAKTRLRNCTNLLSMEAADWLVSPTRWQADLHPPEYSSKHVIIHEGIDTNIVDPIKVSKTILSDLKIPDDAEIVTYSARNLEPYRGFDIAMHAFAKLCHKRPRAHFLIVGADGVSYGSKLRDGDTYKKRILQEVNIDPKRFYWLGKLPYDLYLQVLRSSMAHVYLTYPFVLSWTFHEAMAMECPMVVSATAPVLEVAEDKHTALVADFFASDEIADKLITLLDNRDLAIMLGQNARKKILEEYSTEKIVPRYIEFINNVLSGTMSEGSQQLLRQNRNANLA